MTTPSDLPDWTVGQNTIVTTTRTFHFVVGGSTIADVSNSVGVVIQAAGTVDNTPVRLRLSWQLPFPSDAFVCDQFLTTIPLPGEVSFLNFETPAYGARVQIENQGPHAVDIALFGTGRAIAAPRYLDSTNPSRVLGLDDAFTMDTPIPLPAEDAGDYNVVSNGQTTVTALSNTDGLLQVTWIDSAGHTNLTDLLALTAGTQATVTQALPQCGLGFVFTPAADEPSGVIRVYANPAQI